MVSYRGVDLIPDWSNHLPCQYIMIRQLDNNPILFESYDQANNHFSNSV